MKSERTVSESPAGLPFSGAARAGLRAGFRRAVLACLILHASPQPLREGVGGHGIARAEELVAMGWVWIAGRGEGYRARVR